MEFEACFGNLDQEEGVSMAAVVKRFRKGGGQLVRGADIMLWQPQPELLSYRSYGSPQDVTTPAEALIFSRALATQTTTALDPSQMRRGTSDRQDGVPS